MSSFYASSFGLRWLLPISVLVPSLVLASCGPGQRILVLIRLYPQFRDLSSYCHLFTYCYLPCGAFFANDDNVGFNDVHSMLVHSVWDLYSCNSGETLVSPNVVSCFERYFKLQSCLSKKMVQSPIVSWCFMSICCKEISLLDFGSLISWFVYILFPQPFITKTP